MKLEIRVRDTVYSLETENEVVTIGRSSRNDFVIPEEEFSRCHCTITFRGGYSFIQDLGSKNGVKIDGQRIISHEFYPFYEFSRVILANSFELFLPDNTCSQIYIDPELRYDLSGVTKKTR